MFKNENTYKTIVQLSFNFKGNVICLLALNVHFHLMNFKLAAELFYVWKKKKFFIRFFCAGVFPKWFFLDLFLFHKYIDHFCAIVLQRSNFYLYSKYSTFLIFSKIYFVEIYYINVTRDTKHLWTQSAQCRDVMIAVLIVNRREAHKALL